MTFIIKTASKSAKKLKASVSAASGNGKTYGALLLAFGIVQDWSKIGVIDSENRSAGLYADLGPYKTIDLDPPYSPERYIEALHFARAQGCEAIIVDSITHEWAGTGGCLEIQSSLGGRFQDWAKVTPRHNKFIDAILKVDSHVICTIRRKEDYAMVQGTNGKNYVQKLGLKELQRDGFSYEMDIVFEVESKTHLATATKDRTGLFDDKEPFIITKETGEALRDWAADGRSVLDDGMDAMRLIETPEEFLAIWNGYKELHNNEDFRTLAGLKKKEVTEKAAADKVTSATPATPAAPEQTTVTN